MKITGSNVTIMVKNMDTAINFYQNLGLTIQQRWGDHYAMLTAEGITLGIHPANDSKHTGGTLSSGSLSIGLFIENIEDAKALLDQHKIPYKAENDENSGLYAHFTDPDGTVVYYVQPKW